MRPGQRLTAALARLPRSLGACGPPILLAGCTVLSALTGAPPVRDMRVEGIEAGREPTGRRDAARESPHLLVHVSTDRDLGTYPRDHRTRILLLVGSCDAGVADRSRAAYGAVLETEAGEAVNSGAITPPRPDGRYPYRFVLQLPRHDDNEVCFHLRGDVELGGARRSADFPIPRTLIAEARSRAGLPPALPGPETRFSLVRQEEPLTLCTLPVLDAACSALHALTGEPIPRELRVEALDVEWRAPGRAGERPPPLFRVIFSTELDLSAYERDYGSSIYLRASLCREGQVDPSRQLSGSGLLTERGRPIGYDRPPAPDAAGRYAYRFYLDIPARPRALGPLNIFVAHDIHRDDDDICFYLATGARPGDPDRSPDIRIPYPLIAGAIARAGMPHAAP